MNAPRGQMAAPTLTTLSTITDAGEVRAADGSLATPTDADNTAAQIGT